MTRYLGGGVSKTAGFDILKSPITTAAMLASGIVGSHMNRKKSTPNNHGAAKAREYRPEYIDYSGSITNRALRKYRKQEKIRRKQ